MASTGPQAAWRGGTRDSAESRNGAPWSEGELRQVFGWSLVLCIVNYEAGFWGSYTQSKAPSINCCPFSLLFKRWCCGAQISREAPPGQDPTSTSTHPTSTSTSTRPPSGRINWDRSALAWTRLILRQADPPELGLHPSGLQS